MFQKIRLLLGGMVALLLLVITKAHANQPPITNAGPNQTITTLTTTLAGTITDDGLPNPPGQTTAKWSVLYSSPSGSVVFEDDTKLTTKVTFSGSGRYILLLKGSDGELVTNSTMTIIVNYLPINHAPVVNPGLNQIIYTLQTTLAGSVSDDGLPNPPGKTTSKWSLAFSSPTGGTVTFEDATKLNTKVTFSRAGYYVLTLQATDGALTTSANMTVLVSTNRPPVVDAGPDQTIASLQTQLNGKITDDGLPNPPGRTSAEWVVVFSSPDGINVTFEDATKPSTKVTFGRPGYFILKLNGNDGQYVVGDTMSILVKTTQSAPPGTTGGFLVGSKNKFNPTRGEKARIVMTLPEDGLVRMEVKDMRNHPVRIVLDDAAKRGTETLEWDGVDSAGHVVPSGIYPATITQNGRQIQKIAFIVIH